MLRSYPPGIQGEIRGAKSTNWIGRGVVSLGAVKNARTPCVGTCPSLPSLPSLHVCAACQA